MISLITEAGSFWEKGHAVRCLLSCHHSLQPTGDAELGGRKAESAAASCEMWRAVYMLCPCPHLFGNDLSLGHMCKEQKISLLGTSPHPQKTGACLTSLKW